MAICLHEWFQVDRCRCWSLLQPILSFYTPIGIHDTAFDAEIAAIHIVLSQFFCHTDCVSKVVILCDSRVAHQAISSIEAPLSKDILKCQLLDLLQCHIDIAIQ
ncbi:hypothetical protein TNCV_4769831 [Trichonephila clavipes]|nr:hypothetical protein TNCV_4769831 [Trichonephila clavipes]